MIAASVVVSLDQLSKLWIVYNVQPFDPLVLIPGFLKITHARNPGMMLGLLPQIPVRFLPPRALRGKKRAGNHHHREHYHHRRRQPTVAS